MLVCAFFVHLAHETAGAARTRHSLLPLLGRDNEVQTSGKSCREKAKLCLEVATQAPHPHCHRPRMRAIQYAAASRLKHCCLWNTGCPVKPGEDEWRVGCMKVELGMAARKIPSPSSRTSERSECRSGIHNHECSLVRYAGAPTALTTHIGGYGSRRSPGRRGVRRRATQGQTGESSHIRLLPNSL